MRATRHNARYCKRDGHVFSSKHNDRNYDYENAPNINAKKTPLNIYFNVYDGIYRHKNRSGKMTFEEVENKFYEEHFMAQYLKQQKAYEAKGQQCYMKSFDEWKSAKRYVPEETYQQIGKVEKTIDEKLFTDIVADYIGGLQSWSKQNGEPFTILDWSIQYDEAVPQLHMRQVWHYTDDDGNLCIGQSKALEQAGIPLPDPTKKRSTKNNRKQTYDKYIRQFWLDTCQRHGLDIERVPLVGVEHDKTKEEVLDAKLEELQKLINDNKVKEEALEAKEEALETKEEAFEVYKQETMQKLQKQQNEASNVLSDCIKLHENLKEMSKSYSESYNSKFIENNIAKLDSKLSLAYDVANASQDSKDSQVSL